MAKKQIKSTLKNPLNVCVRLCNSLISIGLLLSIGVAFKPSNSFAAGKKAEIVIDGETGEIIHEDSADETRYPASITKVMTLYLLFEAIENGEIDINDRLTFSAKAASQPPTKLGVKAGNSIDIETAIYGLVVKSSNDVAVAIAERLGSTEAQFAEKMTLKAKDLGMINTNFVNASGLPDANQYSSAEDLAKLAIAIRRDFPREFSYFATESFDFAGATLTNHNHLVGKTDGVDGLKTGYINASGYNLATTSVRDGKFLVTVVMGGKTWRSRDERAEALIDQSYADLGIYSKSASLESESNMVSGMNGDYYFASLPNKAPKIQNSSIKFANNAKKPNPISAPAAAAINVSFVQVASPEPVPQIQVATFEVPQTQSDLTSTPLPEFSLRGKLEGENAKLAMFDGEEDAPIAVKVDFAAFERAENERIEAEAEAAKAAKLKQIALAKAAANKKQMQEKKLAEIALRAEALKAEQERQNKLAQLRGNVVVQVGAFKTQKDANSTIKKLAGAFPSFAKSDISKATNSGGVWFRVRFTGIALGAAKAACTNVIRAGGVCQIISQ